MNIKNEEKLKYLIQKSAKNNIDIYDIKDETSLVDDLLFDSVSIIQLLIEIEEEFNIEFNEDNSFYDIMEVSNNDA